MCKVRDHPRHEEIDLAIAKGMKAPTIFHTFINEGNEKKWCQAIRDYKRYNHVSEMAKSAVAESDKEHGLNIQACAKEIYDLCLRGAKKAESQDLRALGSCVAPAVKVLEILHKGNDKDNDKPGIDHAIERMNHDRDARRANL